MGAFLPANFYGLFFSFSNLANPSTLGHCRSFSCIGRGKNNMGSTNLLTEISSQVENAGAQLYVSIILIHLFKNKIIIRVGNRPPDSLRLFERLSHIDSPWNSATVSPSRSSNPKPSRKRSRSIKSPLTVSSSSSRKRPRKTTSNCSRKRRWKPISGATLAASSSSHVPVQPFWNEQSKKISEKLWLYDSKSLKPTMMELKNKLDSSWPTSRALSRASVSNASSWFTVKSYVPENEETLLEWPSQPLWKVLEQSVTSQSGNTARTRPKPPKRRRILKRGHQAATAATPPSPKPPAGKVRKIRLYPDENQRKRLKEWISTARWTYNRCLETCKEATKSKKALPDTTLLRSLHVHNRNFKHTYWEWVLRTPYEIRDSSLLDLLKNYESNFAKRKNSAKRKSFTMKFRRRKDKQQSIVICHTNWGRKRGKFAFLPKIKSSERIPEKPEYDMRIVINRLGEFYLCLPERLEVRHSLGLSFL